MVVLYFADCFVIVMCIVSSFCWKIFVNCWLKLVNRSRLNEVMNCETKPGQSYQKLTEAAVVQICKFSMIFCLASTRLYTHTDLLEDVCTTKLFYDIKAWMCNWVKTEVLVLCLSGARLYSNLCTNYTTDIFPQ